MGGQGQHVLRIGKVLAASLCLLVALSAATGAWAQDQNPLRGVALVIGQSTYRNLPALSNPRNDARAMSDLLEGLGFDVTTTLDADTAKLAKTLTRFEEDAEGADVALVYYSGHGIEAGGENYLIPIDTASDRPDGMATVSALLERLEAQAPVVLLLLDACRTNPFPPGATIMSAAGAPVPVTAAGLGSVRGAVRLGEKKTGVEGQGAVIGFAAEPGTAALDGDPGGNSPYAAALLKHLGAGGHHFADIMTMVTEEVYLRSSARQLPWTNTSLRRLLYFGAAPEASDGEEAHIRDERRSLLLTIATLPAPERQQVAAAASAEGVPMDALFAMLRQAGDKAPATPDAFDALLREQGARLKGLLATGKPAGLSDPELQRLSALADTAVREGALATALGIYGRAKARMATLEPGLSEVESGTDALRRERALVLAQSAETALLAFDHAQAAEDYASAFDEVERFDDDLAFRYKLGEARALNGLGFYRADNAALDRAIETYRDAGDMVPLRKKPAEWLDAQIGLGQALATRADRASDPKLLAEAADTLSEALDKAPPATEPATVSAIRAELAYALLLAGMRETGTESLDEAADLLREAMAVTTKQNAPQDWARLNHRLAATLLERGGREQGVDVLQAALAAADEALTVRTREAAPLDWAATANNRAIILASLGERDAEPLRLRASVEAYNAILTIYTREDHPLLWAETLANLGAAQFALSSRGDGVDRAREAAETFRQAMTEMTRERAPLRWAALQDNLGMALRVAGDADQKADLVREAIAAFEGALAERKREIVPALWADTQRNLANALWSLGTLDKDPEALRRGLDVLRAADEVTTRQLAPRSWARARNNEAGMLRDLGTMTSDTGALKQAVAAYKLALEVNTKADSPLDFAQTIGNMGLALSEIGTRDKDRTALAEARTALETAAKLYADAGIDRYAGFFESSLVEIQIAELQIEIDERIKAAPK
jgi:uncharacterized caspase-like protein